MEISIGYRPCNGLLTLHNMENEDLLDMEAGKDDVVCLQDGTDEKWHTLIAFYKDEFLAMTALGVKDQAAGWNLWLSLYLPDSVVAEICDMIERWDLEFDLAQDEMSQMTRLLLVQRDSVEF